MSHTNKKLTNKQKKNICNNYKNKRSTVMEMCRVYRVSPNTLYSILKEHNINLRGNKTLLSTQQKVTNLYKKGFTCRQIKDKLNIGVSTISKYLKDNNTKTRQDAGQFKRKYRIDDTVFKKIDSKEKAQFLGLIYSDGTVSRYNKLISVRLREDDFAYLDSFRSKVLKTNKPLYITKNNRSIISPLNNKKYIIKYGTAILDITNSAIYSDAINIGLCPNKTVANIGMPKIPKKYIPYFILGLFEGDGCITYNKKYQTYAFTIACQSNMAQDLYDYFHKLKIKALKYKRNSIYILQISNQKDIYKIYNMFYTNKTKCIMQRKYKKFKKMISNMNLR